MADQQAGWYPDPAGDASKLRYWNGTQWTNDYTDVPQSTSPVQPVAQPVQPVAQPVQPYAQSAQPYTQPVNAYTNPAAAQVNAQPLYAQAAAPSQTNGFAIAALICGIAGMCPLLPFIASIAAIVLGALGRKKENGKGMALAGLIIGIIGVAGWVLYIILAFILAASSPYLFLY